MTTAQTIRNIALNYLDQEETAGNSGFVDPKFQEMMKLAGWQKGQAWCAYFVELVYREAGLTEIADALSAGAVDTWNRMQKNQSVSCGKTPVVGAIAIWQNVTGGVPSWSGHAAIVAAYFPRTGQMITAEGNTDGEGGREGFEVAMRIRTLEFNRDNGLRLLGFIIPKNINA